MVTNCTHLICNPLRPSLPCMLRSALPCSCPFQRAHAASSPGHQQSCARSASGAPATSARAQQPAESHRMRRIMATVKQRARSGHVHPATACGQEPVRHCWWLRLATRLTGIVARLSCSVPSSSAVLPVTCAAVQDTHTQAQSGSRDTTHSSCHKQHTGERPPTDTVRARCSQPTASVPCPSSC